MADANVRQDWYPPLWRPTPRFVRRQVRPTLSAATRTFDVPIDLDKARLRFECLHPEFAAEFGNKNRWANVISLRDWTYKDQIATVFPTNHRISKFPRLSFTFESTLSTTEGFVILPDYKGIAQLWDMPDGATAIGNWLEKQGISAVRSDAGRATQQIIQTLGGFAGVSCFAHPAIVRLLDSISRRPISRSAHYKEFADRITTAVKGDIWRGDNFDNLVHRNAVELGLELKCGKCFNWSWYALNELGYKMNCRLCLRHFDFSISNPGGNRNSRWAYRLVGPFALPDYARGGYAAALALRFFGKTLAHFDQARMTWSAGQELDLGPSCKVEADFIFWYQHKYSGNDYPSDLVFGEAKSFGREAFRADDISKMKSLAVRFPSALIVFATMKEAADLSEDEIRLLRRFAEWGREPVGPRKRARAPVILLTGTEMFAAGNLSYAWKGVGGAHAEFARLYSGTMINLRILADLTQQLYLGMSSYGNWREERWKKRAARKVAREVLLRPENADPAAGYEPLA